MFRVYFAKFCKNNLKGTISFKAPTNPLQKNQSKFICNISQIWCTFQILGGCQGRRTGVAVTTVSSSLILGGWVTKVLKNGDKN